MNLSVGAHYLRSGYRLKRSNWSNRRLTLIKGSASAGIANQDDRKLAIEYKIGGGWMLDSTCIEMRDILADDWEIDYGDSFTS